MRTTINLTFAINNNFGGFHDYEVENNDTEDNDDDVEGVEFYLINLNNVFWPFFSF